MRTDVKIFLASCAIVAAVGCTNTGLHQEVGPPPPPPQTTIKLKGTFCTEDPQTVKYPVKIFFVIDDTGSMQQNDPNQVRYTAAEQLAVALQDTSAKPAMYFGALKFSDNGIIPVPLNPAPTPPNFTTSSTIFVQGVQNPAFRGPGAGGTPYRAPLNTTLATIESDITFDPVLARRTRYVVIFLSDGQPTDGSDTDGTALGAVDQLVLLKSKAGDVTVNTVVLGGSGEIGRAHV